MNGDTKKNDKSLVGLDTTELKEIETSFSSAKDFRTIGERITAPIDSIISKTADVIDKDPIMDVSGNLQKMNSDVQKVYKDIIDNDGSVMKFFKSLPLVGGLAKSLDAKIDETTFNIKGVEGQIQVIFSGFDQSYNSVNTSIDIQKTFVEGIDKNLEKVIAYKEFITTKIEELKTRVEDANDEEEKSRLAMFLRNVEFFQGNLVVLIGNLDMAKKRLLMKLDSANKLSLAMNSSRPIFKTLLSTAIIETSSQKAIEASIKAMDVMGKTIDKMSTELTDKTIETSKKAEEISSKPVLSSTVFIENVTKLRNHFDQIEDFRLKIATEAEAERKLFAEASNKLAQIKVLNAKDTEQINKELLTEG